LKIDNEVLTPERHNVPSIVKVPVVMNHLSDSLEKIFFLSLYNKLKRFDLPFYFQTMKTSKQDNNIVNVLSEIGAGEEVQEMPVVETFFRTRFYGILKKDCLTDLEGIKSNDPNSLLIIAEASTKQGRLEEARTIYEYLLSPNVSLTQNQWTMASIYLAHLDSRSGKGESCINKLQNIYDSIDNKIFRSYIKQMMARTYYESGDHEKALELFTESINSFNKFGLPLMLAITHNNRGIIHYIFEDIQNAENDWNKARKYARDAGSRYVEAAIFTNLADVELLRGNLEKSWKYTEMSHERYSSVHDLEGMAEVDFQRALYYLHVKDLDEALNHYRRWESLAFPLPSPGQRDLKKKVFQERLQENGFDPDEIPI
jgi:tetratricopeptide (TPR) repeat protein